MKTFATLFVSAAFVLTFVGCSSNKPLSMAPVEAKKAQFVPPAAEQAYRLQDDCSRRGEDILRDHHMGSALTHEQVSRYNATTNRCYVRLQVHAMDLSEWDKYDNSTYLEDGQTGELLALYTHRAGGATSYLGFGCADIACVEDKVAMCMSGKECEPE